LGKIAFSGAYPKLKKAKVVGVCGIINIIPLNMKINLPKLADVCGYVLPTNVQNITQKQ